MGIPWELALSFGLGIAGLYLIGRVLMTPMGFLWRLVAGSLLGGLCLMILAHFEGYIGIAVPVNPLTALMVGLLGVPGFGLILALAALL